MRRIMVGSRLGSPHETGYGGPSRMVDKKRLREVYGGEHPPAEAICPTFGKPVVLQKSRRDPLKRREIQHFFWRIPSPGYFYTLYKHPGFSGLFLVRPFCRQLTVSLVRPGNHPRPFLAAGRLRLPGCRYARLSAIPWFSKSHARTPLKPGKYGTFLGPWC